MKRRLGGQDPAELSADHRSVLFYAVHSIVLPVVSIFFLYRGTRPQERGYNMKTDRDLFYRRYSPIFRKRSVAAFSDAFPGNHSLICHHVRCRIHFSVDVRGVDQPAAEEPEPTGRCLQRRE